MAIDEIRQEKPVIVTPDGHSHSAGSVGLIIILALLAVGEIVTLSKMSSVRGYVEAQQAQMRKDLNDQISSRLSALENSNAQQLEGLRNELDKTAERMGSTGKQLNNARTMVARLQKQQQREAELIAKKADEEKVGALTQDVSATKTDLDTTKKNVDAISKDLGMAKSEFGTLIAKNHDDIETLRKLGERDYFEFTLNKNLKQNVAGLGLILKKTNVKHSRFDMTLLADDLKIDKKSRTVNEPVFFYVAGSKKPYELVVNKVESNRATGYVSTPKGATEQLASRTEGR